MEPCHRQSDRRMSLPQFYTCVCQLLSLQSEHTQLQACTLQRQPYFCCCKHALCNGNFTFVAANIPPATTLLFSIQNSSDFRVCRFKYFQLQIAVSSVPQATSAVANFGVNSQLQKRKAVGRCKGASHKSAYKNNSMCVCAVSYTHLTLPTNHRV